MATKRATFLIDLGDSKEAWELLIELDKYISLHHGNRKRFYLTAATMLVSDDSPKLVMQIAEYLAGVGSPLGRRG